MKHFFTFLLALSCSILIQAQCTDLFISEYVEGWSNNKALEIYNPTPNSIDLSGYTLSRYSNGGVTPSTTQLEGTIQPYSTFVVGLDKRNPDGEGFEAPMWDGYYTYIDDETGEEVTIFDSDTDLQSRVDLFINPIYYTGSDPDEAIANPNTMYFNGNDAVTLEPLGGFPVDIFGQVGFDPGAAWTDDAGNYWTKDHTLIRKASILEGETNPLIASFDPTLEWDSLPANTFVNLGFHDCECNPSNKLIETQNSFVVYPNPSTQHEFTIRNNNEITNVIIYNNLGEVVLNKSVRDITQLPIKLRDNKEGVYLISIVDNTGIKTKSVILR